MKNKLPHEATGKVIKGYIDSKIAKGETNDCVVRAFATSFEVSYDYAHKYVAEEFKRQPRKGTFGTAMTIVNMYTGGVVVNNKKIYPIGEKSNRITIPYSLTYKVNVKGELIERQMTVGTFIKKNPKGTFFVLVKGHAFTIKDGVVIGNFEDAVKAKRPMRCAFEIK